VCKIGWWLDGIMYGNGRIYKRTGTKEKGWYHNNKRTDVVRKDVNRGIGRFWKMKNIYFYSKNDKKEFSDKNNKEGSGSNVISQISSIFSGK